MNLLSRVRSSFSQVSRARGQEYFRAGRIALAERGDGVLHLVARGTDTYDVRMVKGDGELTLSCTCPHFDDGFPCKHIWAALLAVQADPATASWVEDGSVEVTFDYGDDSVEGGQQDEDAEPGEREEDDEAGSRADRPGHDAGREAARRFWEYRQRRAASTPAWDREPRGGDNLSPFSSYRSGGDAGVAWRAPFDRVRDAMDRTEESVLDGADVPAGELVYLVDTLTSATYDDLTIEIARRDRRKNGEWGKPKTLRLRRSQVRQLPSPEDRRLVSALLGASEWYGGYDYHPVPTRLHVPPELARTLVPALCASGRLFLTRGSDMDPTPLRWDGDEPWQFRLRVQAGGDNGGARYVVTGHLVRGGETRPLSAARLVTPTLVFQGHEAAPLDESRAWPWLRELRGNASIAVPAVQAPRLLETLFTLPQVPPVDLPEHLRVDERTAAPVPSLHLFHAEGAPAGGRQARITAALAFDYDGTLVPASERRAVLFEPEQRVVLRRQLESERHARGQLQRLGFRATGRGSDERLAIDPHRVPRAIRELLAEGWRVEADGRLYRSPGRSRLSVKSGIDWFELHGEAEFGDQVVPLPQLLKALSRGERVVTLGDGSLGLLPEEWLRRFAGVAQLGEVKADYLRFRPTQVAVLDALLASQPETDFDATFQHALEAVRQFEHITPADPSPGFVGSLRGYQREGLGWLEFLRTLGFGGCLADDMGLGKTVMVLALLDRHRGEAPRPSLVVAPRSVVFNWLREAERFTPGLRVGDYTGPNRAQVLGRLDRCDVLVTTYGTLRQDAALLKDIEFEYVVLDESQAIKNAATASAKAARVLSARHRLALSGTPIENHVGELWSLFDFLNPGMLGSRSVLARKKGAADGREPATAEDTAAPATDLQLLAKVVRPFILRRTKEQVARDLPERQEETIWCELEGPERRLYEELRDHYRATLLGMIEQRGMGRSKLQVLEALLRLRQAACHPGLLDRGRANGSSAKFEALLPQLAELREEGHKALVFSQFTSLLAILRKRLDEEGVPYEYLDGQTRNREERVSRFQEDASCGLFLISLKAGGLGLNLTAADYVFLLDPWWNPAVEAQAIDRAHRIGQTRPVFAYRLIARDTVEERILDLQQQKRDLADAIISEDNSLVAGLTREELEALLS